MPILTSLRVLPVTSSVGAVVEGADLGQALFSQEIEQIGQALVDYGVLFFRDQDISLEQFWAFMLNFGTPQVEETTGTEHDKVDDVKTANYMLARHSTAVWHSDVTSMAKPPMVTALRAVKIPPFGGDTCWSSMYAAYDGLTEPMKRMLDGLTAVHSIQPTYDRMKDYAQLYEAKYSTRHAPEQIHPVIITHPVSERKALYVNESFTTRIVELSFTESAAILSLLFRHIESPNFTMRWKWSANDLAFWDNRSVQHFAVPDYDSERLMQRIVLAGAKPSA